MLAFGSTLQAKGLGFLLGLALGGLSSLNETKRLGEARARALTVPLVFSLIFLVAKPALAGLLFLGKLLCLVSSLRGLPVTGEMEEAECCCLKEWMCRRSKTGVG